ncbi:hypothetical protein C922_05451 [Plasmodium inui San Antonio 1]|uniref:Uncharacterized protein n=1 Tax=Plasmodium inui San Antonio 1 TaxID=1237626 RepID=W6ZY17_9APIC|nr:hypothetical protein C922_05451 [Plasmodium inui San Antonio 1]EUD64170.1 hypothetical protein C922_05451 [Plasmodium inui San Antonio 1]
MGLPYQGVSFKNYMLSLTNRVTGTLSEIEDVSEEANGRRLGILSKDTDEIIDVWNWFEQGGHDSTAVRRLWEYSLRSCIKLEAWWNNLQNKGVSEGRYDQGPCHINEIQVGGGQIGFGTDCQIHKSELAWNQKGSLRHIQGKGQENRSLAICRDLVTQVMLAFEMISSSTQSRDKLKQENPCMRLYRGLVQWGGEAVAHEVMKDWFTGEGNCMGGGGFSSCLKGLDLYEVVSEILYGYQKGDKNISCQKVPKEISDEKTEQEEYRLSGVEGASFSSCASGGQTCEDRLRVHDGEVELHDLTTPAELTERSQGRGDPSPGFPVGHNSGTSGMSGDSKMRHENEESYDSTGQMLQNDVKRVFSDRVPLAEVLGGILASLGSVAALYGYYRIYYLGRGRQRKCKSSRGNNMAVTYASL